MFGSLLDLLPGWLITRRDAVLAVVNLSTLGGELAGAIPEPVLLTVSFVTLLVGLYDFDVFELAFGVGSSYFGTRGTWAQILYGLPLTIFFLSFTLFGGLPLEGIWILLVLFVFSLWAYTRIPEPEQLTQPPRNDLEQLWCRTLSNPRFREPDAVFAWGLIRIPVYQAFGALRVAYRLLPYYLALLTLYSVIAVLESRVMLAVAVTVFITIVAISWEIREASSEGSPRTVRGLERIEQIRGETEGEAVAVLKDPMGISLAPPLVLFVALGLYIPSRIVMSFWDAFGTGTFEAVQAGETLLLFSVWAGAMLVPLAYTMDFSAMIRDESQGSVPRPFLHLAGAGLSLHVFLAYQPLDGGGAIFGLEYLSIGQLLAVLTAASYLVHRVMEDRIEATGRQRTALGLALLAVFLVPWYHVGLLYLAGAVFTSIAAATLIWATRREKADLEAMSDAEPDADDSSTSSWGTLLILGVLGVLFVALRGYQILAEGRSLTLTDGALGFLLLLGFILGGVQALDDATRDRVAWLVFGMKEEPGEPDRYREIDPSALRTDAEPSP